MIFWLLTLIVLASLAGLGYRQGAIRVAMSFLGILFGVWLAGMLSGPIVYVLKPIGVKSPILLWMLPPLIVFCIVSAAFKMGALAIHKKVEVYFKYKAGDLRLALWERLMARLGLCLGVLNGTAYLILLSGILYGLSYWTVQIGASDQAPWNVKLLNRLGWDMDHTGFVKTARAVDPFPEYYYKTADVAGLVYQNSLLEARLSRYPAFLILGEQPSLRRLADDQSFADLRLRQAPLKEVLNNPNVDAVIKDSKLADEIWETVKPNLDDLQAYLNTGISKKFGDETIYGRWHFNPSASASSLRRQRPNMTSREMQRTRQILQAFFGKASLVIGTKNRLIAKSFSSPQLGAGAQPAPEGASADGEWKPDGENYKLNFEAGGQTLNVEATVQGERLILTGEQFPLVFDREV